MEIVVVAASIDLVQTCTVRVAPEVSTPREVRPVHARAMDAIDHIAHLQQRLL